MTVHPFTVWVQRSGHWEGKWVVHHHSPNFDDAMWVAQHSVPITPVVQRIELRCPDRAPRIVFDRAEFNK